MHWFWKLMIVVTSLVVVGIVGLALVIYIALPSPAKMREGLFAKAKTTAASGAPKTAPLPESSTTRPSQLPSQTSAAAADAQAESKAAESERIFMAFLDPSRPMSRACDSLRSIKYPQQAKLDMASFGRRFKESLEDHQDDPQFESLSPILKYSLTRPKMREIIERIRTAKAQTMMEEFKTKKDFYFLIADAYEEMKSNRLAMQNILDQSYLTMMLGRAVETKPSLAQDTAVMDYCRDIESQLNQQRATDFDSEKKAFEEFLTASQIDPKSIGYDPHYKTDLQIVFNEHGLHFTGGWIDQIFAQLTPPPKK